MKPSILIVSGVLVVTGVASAIAHGGATGIVKDRMDAMSSMAKVMKSLTAVMRGDVAYDAEAVRGGANVIKSHAGESMTHLFPEGSGGGASEAKPEIWSDWQEFASLSDQLKVFASALGEAADKGLEQSGAGVGKPGLGTMMGQGGMMGSAPMMGNTSDMAGSGMLAKMPVQGLFNRVAQTCSACHTKFRIEKK
ncbi:MAG: cytochrome c [Roseibium sp.]